MGKSKKATDKTELVKKVSIENETILVFKPIKRLTEEEHEQLASKIRYEEEKSGVKIVLMPFSVNLEDESNEKFEEALNEVVELRKYKETVEQELDELRKFKENTELELNELRNLKETVEQKVNIQVPGDDIKEGD